MADSRDELDPTQATEATLCAYLEGTLSATERVEIEKYLAQSPTHRKLLRDLAATRKWVSDLPKEMAPPDIAEMFEQHTERTMLLDDSASTVSIRINRGPQVMLAAAILLLAVGLGAIIFIVLNAKGPTAQNYASSMKTDKAIPGSTPKDATPKTVVIPGTVARSMNTLSPPAAAPALIPAAPPAVDKSGGVFADVANGAPAPARPSPAASGAATSTPIIAGNAAAAQSAGAPPVTAALASVPATFAPSATTQPMQAFATSAKAKQVATRETAAAADVALADQYHAETLVAQQGSTTKPTATTQSLTVAVGDRLSVDIPQLVGPGVEKTTTVRVDNDGKISLPMLDAMPAAGQTTAALQKQIADRYRAENLIARPVVTVTRVTATATTMPTTMPGTRPTTRPVPYGGLPGGAPVGPMPLRGDR